MLYNFSSRRFVDTLFCHDIFCWITFFKKHSLEKRRIVSLAAASSCFDELTSTMTARTAPLEDPLCRNNVKRTVEHVHDLSLFDFVCKCSYGIMFLRERALQTYFFRSQNTYELRIEPYHLDDSSVFSSFTFALELTSHDCKCKRVWNYMTTRRDRSQTTWHERVNKRRI